MNRRESCPRNCAVDSAPSIHRVGIVGAGVMGAGIAQLAALRGLEIVVQEVNEAALAAGMERLAALFQKAAERRLLSPEEAQQKLASIQRTTTWEGFGDVDVVIEAAVEELPLKQALFRELERRTRPATLLATNTSSLLVRQLQEGLEHPQRVAGLHFFNPVHKLPLVEVVRAPATSEPTMAALSRWAVALGKTPVRVADSPGFIVNRILMPYLFEAVVLAAQGVPVTLLDTTMRRFGMPMGPLELLDQVGLDVAAHVARALRPIFADRLGARRRAGRAVADVRADAAKGLARTEDRDRLLPLSRAEQETAPGRFEPLALVPRVTLGTRARCVAC